MKTTELLEKHPLTTEVIRQWFFKELIKSIDIAEDVPEEFKQAMLKEGVSDERLAILIDAQPRTLFDVFDENKLLIEILYTKDLNSFHYNIITENIDYDNIFIKRKKEEQHAIKKAFELLEERLKPIDLPKLEE